METEKKIRIKMNAIKRLKKEEKYYDGELSKIAEKIENMVKLNPEDYNIKKMREILEETMITKSRTMQLTESFTQDLRDIISEHLETGDIDMNIINEINEIED